MAFDIDIAVCTFRRASLSETLTSLAKLEQPAQSSIAVIVADNDETDSARAQVVAFAAEAPFPVSYIHAPARNISVARNACLGASKARYLAFLDDDEVAAPGWLSALVAALSDGYVAAFGPVDAVYTDDAPLWMRRGRFHDTRPVWVNGELRTGYTCNVLLDRGADAVRTARFDPALGRSGGEDTAFFAELYRTGHRFAFAADARLTEPVPAERASISWLRARRFRMGQTHGRIIGQNASTVTRVRQAAVAGLKLSYCALFALLQAPLPVRRNRAILRGTLHAGVISGLFGADPKVLYGTDPPAFDGSRAPNS